MLGLNSKYSLYTILLFTLISYFVLGYFFDRSQFYLLLFLYSICFFGFLYFVKSDVKSDNLFAVGLVIRLVLLFSTPFLSQDFYRFIWDGRLFLSGINPYEYVPNSILNNIATFEDAAFLHQKMGNLSASNFSNYPPFNQFIFVVGAWISGKSIFLNILFFKMIIILADIGIYHFGKKILKHFNSNPKAIFLYFLNPLVILELTGNLHFEGVMLFFLILGFYFLIRENWILAAFCIAISISTKLLPLLILPIFFQYFTFKKVVAFYILIIAIFTLLFIPFVTTNLIDNYLKSISLWFVTFEFNASIYYLCREVGFYIKGYNTIGIIGKIIPVVAILIVLFYAFLKKNRSLQNIITHSLLALTFYFFLSTTVHPWYIINLVVLSVFTRYTYPLVWSFVIIVSYYAYSGTPFQEKYILLFIEYTFVFGIFITEIIKKQSFNNNLLHCNEKYFR